MAVKFLDQRKSNLHRRAFVMQAIHESRLWQAGVKHPNVLQLHDVFIDTAQGLVAYFVMERCVESLACKYAETPATEVELQPAAMGLVAGLSYLARQRILHRDVSPGNMLLKEDSSVRICDFGVAVQLGVRGRPDGRPKQVRGHFGTPAYMAPEMVLGELYDLSVDAWSLGASCYFLLFGKVPYSPNESERSARPSMSVRASFKAAIADADEDPSFDVAMELEEPCSDAALHFLEGFLTRDPAHRRSLEAATQHRFVRPLCAPRRRSTYGQPSAQLAARACSDSVGIAPTLLESHERRVRTNDFLALPPFEKLAASKAVPICIQEDLADAIPQQAEHTTSDASATSTVSGMDAVRTCASSCHAKRQPDFIKHAEAVCRPVSAF